VMAVLSSSCARRAQLRSQPRGAGGGARSA